MKKRGISLIVLVITIVIVIILAATVILNLSKNNPINQAKEALILQDTENLQGMYDAKVAGIATSNLGYPKLYTDSTYSSKLEGDVQINSENAKIGKIYYMAGSEKGCIVFGKEGTIEEDSNIKYSYLNQELPIYHNSDIKWYISQNGHISVYEYEKVEIGEEVTKENSTITGKEPTYNNPVIPVGFKPLDTENAKWKSLDGKTVQGWNDGLVIEDSVGNQFVWVPVDGTNVRYEKWFGGKNTSNITDINQLLDDSLPSEVTSEEYQITKYGGFYIGRYETGIPESMTDAIINVGNRCVEGKPVVKKNQVPWNCISYAISKANAESMYTEEKVKSGLVTGTMWDTVMLWLKNSEVNVGTDCISWGNFRYSEVTGITEYSVDGNYGVNWNILDVPVTKPNAGSIYADWLWLLKTGNSEYTKRKNIYDLAGNLWEWTSEIYSSDYVLRGGYYASDGRGSSAASRMDVKPTDTQYYSGFRTALYIK